MKLKNLVKTYGIDKINTFTKYPSILTLHQLGDRGRLKDELTTPIDLNKENYYFTEKIDGTNVRIICWGDEYLIGSRKDILYYSGDLCHNPSMDIVDLVHELVDIPSTLDHFTVIYGELYGGKIGANAKQYGKDKNGFRVFDVFEHKNMKKLEHLLSPSIEEISQWREHETGNGLVYGQRYLNRASFDHFCDFNGLEIAPELQIRYEHRLNDLSHESVMNFLQNILPKSNVVLSEKGLGKSEGVIMRNGNRSKIVKLRFEDYQRTLKNK